jgi:hypothetical protein
LKRPQAVLKTQYRDQLLIDPSELVGFPLNQMQLPKKQAIAAQHQQNDEHKAGGQPPADTDPVQAQTVFLRWSSAKDRFWRHALFPMA